MPTTPHYATKLSPFFFQPITLSPPPTPHIVALNEPLARELGLDPQWLRSAEGINFLCCGILPDKDKHPHGQSPIAAAYAGHQFGHFVPRLGDGRAALIADCQQHDGTMMELHIKGAGPTPFSRSGDGKNTLGPALREYLVSEAMAALNIPTTRALAVITTGENIEREDEILPGAILVRAARSHVRVGTFQYAAAHGGIERVKELADFTINRLFPEITPDQPDRYLAFFKHVLDRQAALVARWMGVGFIHGVMNTDNCALSGETLDYGPCAFMDHFDPMKHFSFIDKEGRYAYGRQPALALWNLRRLAECLFPLFDETEEKAIEIAQAALRDFNRIFPQYWLAEFRQKLGLEVQDEHDVRLLEHFLETMHNSGADFTQSFSTLTAPQAAISGNYTAMRALFKSDMGHFDLCRTELLHRLTEETRSPTARQAAMSRVNPQIIPRNHLVERALTKAIAGDYTLFFQLHEALKTPFDKGDDLFTLPPTPQEEVVHTFCGT